MFESLTPSDCAAWLGAITGSCALVWDLYKWKRSGPRLTLDVVTNMKTYGLMGIDNNKYITVRAVNTGDRATTLTNLAYVYYSGWIKCFLRKPKQSFVVPMPIGQSIPFMLTPGTIWDSSIRQNEDIEGMAKDGCLEVHLYSSDSKKPVRKKLRFKWRSGEEKN